MQVLRKMLLSLVVAAVVAGMCPSADAKDIFKYIPADSPLFVVAPNAAELGDGLKTFAGSLKMPQLPPDPMAVFAMQSGITFEGDQSAAYLFLSDNVSGKSLKQIYMDNIENGAETPPPFVFILTGGQVERDLAMLAPRDQGNGTYFFGSSDDPGYARQVGDDLILSTSLEWIDAVLAASNSVADSYDAARLAKLKTGHVSLSLDPKAFMPLAKVTLDKVMEEMKQGMQDEYLAPQQRESMEMAAAVLPIYYDILSQLDYADVTVTMSAKGLQFDKYLAAKADSKLAKFASAIKPTSRPLFAGLPAGDLLCAFGLNLGDDSNGNLSGLAIDLASWGLSLSATSNMKIDKDKLVAGLSALSDGIAIISSAGIYIGGSEPVNIVGSSKIKDFDSYIGIMKLYDSLGDMYTYTSDVATVSGVSVSSLVMKEPAGSDLSMSPMASFLQQYFAPLPNGDLGYAVGKAENIQLAIDGMDNGLQKSDFVSKALAVMPENTCMAIVVSPKTVGKFVAGLPLPVPPQMLQMLLPTCEEPIVIAQAFDGKMGHGRMLIPSALFADAGRIYMQFMMMQMQMQSAPNMQNSPDNQSF